MVNLIEINYFNGNNYIQLFNKNPIFLYQIQYTGTGEAGFQLIIPQSLKNEEVSLFMSIFNNTFNYSYPWYYAFGFGELNNNYYLLNFSEKQNYNTELGRMINVNINKTTNIMNININFGNYQSDSGINICNKTGNKYQLIFATTII